MYHFYLRNFILIFSFVQRKKSEAVQEARKIIRLYVPYFVLIILSVFFAVLLNRYVIDLYGIKYWTRFFDKLLLRISSIIIVITSWEINKKYCIDSLRNAVVIDGIFIITLSIIRWGLKTTLCACIAPLGLAAENNATQLLEVHESTFVVGLLLLYYLYFYKFKEKKFTFIILILLFIIGGKRIAVAALALAIIYLSIIKRKFKWSFYLPVNMLIMFFCFIYVGVIYSGSFREIMDALHININNRDLIYTFFLRRTEFSPLYFGWGFSAVSRAIENMPVSEVKWMYVVRGLHSDLLKQYIEFGFLGFIYWLYYFLLYLPYKYYKSFNKDAAKIYIVLIVYSFITYFTDNTEGYVLFQSTLLFLPLMAASQNKE